MTTAVLDHDPLPVRPGRRAAEPGFRDLLRCEWTKFTSLRSTWWSLTAVVVLGLGMTVLATAVLTAQWGHLGPSGQTQYRQDTIGLILQPGSQWAALAACVLGVLFIASEFATGMIRSTVLATPRRTPVLAAKAVVLGSALFVLAELLALPSFLIGSAITHSHAPTALTSPTTLRALLAFGVFVALTGLIALCVGTLLRHPAAAISAMVALQFVLPGALSALPGGVGSHIAGAMPAGGNVIMGSGHDATDAYSPLQALLILVGWTLVMFLVARISLKRRNV